MAGRGSPSPLGPISSLLSGGGAGMPGNPGSAVGGFRGASNQPNAFNGMGGTTGRSQPVATPQTTTPTPTQPNNQAFLGRPLSVPNPTPLNFGVPAWFQGMMAQFGQNLPFLSRRFSGAPNFSAFGEPSSAPASLLSRLVG